MVSPANTPPTIVLVVEDEALVRMCAVQQLEDAGFGVLEAPDAIEALRQFLDHPEITAVFSDINMPGAFDGLALMHKIFGMRPNVRLVLPSGRGAPAQSELPDGVRFLLKPYHSKELASLVQAA